MCTTTRDLSIALLSLLLSYNHWYQSHDLESDSAPHIQLKKQESVNNFLLVNLDYYDRCKRVCNR